MGEYLHIRPDEKMEALENIVKDFNDLLGRPKRTIAGIVNYKDKNVKHTLFVYPDIKFLYEKGLIDDKNISNIRNGISSKHLKDFIDICKNNLQKARKIKD